MPAGLIRTVLVWGMVAVLGGSAIAADRYVPEAQLVGGDATPRVLLIGKGKSLVYDFARDIRNVLVGDPKTAQAVILSQRRASILGVNIGATTINFYAADGKLIAAFDVTIGRDTTIIRTAIHKLIPNSAVDVESIGDGIILNGTVATQADSQLAYEIASHFVAPNEAWSNGSGGTNAGSGTATSFNLAGGPSLPGGNALNNASASKVVNAIVVRSRDQIMLKVTVAEMNRTVLKQLGVNLNGSVVFGSTVLNLNNANPFPVNGALATPNTFNSMGVPLGGLAAPLTGVPNSPVGLTGTSKSITANLQALEEAGVIRTLAEPSLTAISGETARFLAGGSFPYPTVSGCTTSPCPLNIAFQPFGVGLNFTPVVLSEGRISLHVSAEVSALDPANSVTVEGTTIPGLNIRRAETVAEIPSGGTLIMAGMIENQTKQTISGLPGAMEIPVLGALFKSRDYQNNLTELVFIVTPYIAHAVAQKDTSRPDDGFADASDPASVLLGRLNRIYGVGGTTDPPNNYRGKYGFILD